MAASIAYIVRGRANAPNTKTSTNDPITAKATDLRLRSFTSTPSRSEVAAKSAMRAPAIPKAVRDLLVERAEGNPYYMEELIKMLIDQGVISPGIDHWQVFPQRLHQVSVPHTLTGVLQARLDGLPGQERRTLQVASVVGRSFWDATVTELMQDAPEQVGSTLREIRQRELIYQIERSSFASTEEYIFKHALLRDVTYETVLLKQRREYHARAARWLEAHAAERLGEYLGQIAEHYAHAGENSLAATYLERSGDEALRTNTYRPARETYEHALELKSQKAAGRGALLVKLGQACWNLGDYPAASAALALILMDHQPVSSLGVRVATFCIAGYFSFTQDHARVVSGGIAKYENWSGLRGWTTPSA